MHFADPQKLWWLLLLLPMMIAWATYLGWKKRVIARAGDASLIHAMAAAHSPLRQHLRAAAIVLATALLCVAVARPQWGVDDRPMKRFGVDVVFALDISKSMLAQDIPPSRLDAARQEIRQALTTLAGDQVGLVVFTAVSFAQSPLTTDYGALRFYLDKLDPEQMPVGGTSVGQAIWDGIDLLGSINSEDDEASPPLTSSDADSQIIVLITDGEDHESNPMRMAREAKQRGIKIVTVGIGSPEGSKIPVYDAQGELRGYKRDQRGELVNTRLDDQTLRRIAQETGGVYVPYSGENSVANAISDYVDRLERREIQAMLRERYIDRFAYFVTPAVLLLLLALLLPERRRRPTRRETSVLMILTCLVATGCDDALRDTLAPVDRGNARVEAGDYAGALEAYRQAEELVPDRPELRYDLGVAHLGAEEFDSAQENLARSLSTDDPVLRFDALYNLGLALSGKQDWQAALQTYKRALRVPLDADSTDHRARIERARHNLEVVLRELYPPCNSLEDSFEENDTAADARALEQPTLDELTLCGLDDDWFAVPVSPGATLSVNATFDELRDQPDPERAFLPRPQDLHLSVFDSSATQVLAVDQGGSDANQADARAATRTIDSLVITQDMLGESSNVLIKVGAAQELEFGYELSTDVILPCDQLEDDYEPNDSQSLATALEPGKYDAHYCSGDPDWYALELGEEDALFVDLQTGEDAEMGARPDLAAQLIRASDGAAIATSRADGDFETIALPTPPGAGLYWLRVDARTPSQQGPYRLNLYRYGACPDDDSFEDNDEPASAADLPPDEPLHRYLRLCGGDRDYYRVRPSEDKNVSWGLRRVSEGDPGTTTEESGPSTAAKPSLPRLTLLNDTAETVLARGTPPSAKGDTAQPSPAPHDDASDPQESASFDQVVVAKNVDAEAAVLQVTGPQLFYHLGPLNPPESDEQNPDADQSPDDSSDQENDSERDDEQDSQSDEEDSSAQDDGQADQDEQQPDQPQEERDEAEADEPQEDPREDQQEPNSAMDEAEQEQLSSEEQRLEDILRALEQTDSNFQLRKALEDMPERDIERDW